MAPPKTSKNNTSKSSKNKKKNNKQSASKSPKKDQDKGAQDCPKNVLPHNEEDQISDGSEDEKLSDFLSQFGPEKIAKYLEKQKRTAAPAYEGNGRLPVVSAGTVSSTLWETDAQVAAQSAGISNNVLEESNTVGALENGRVEGQPPGSVVPELGGRSDPQGNIDDNPAPYLAVGKRKDVVQLYTNIPPNIRRSQQQLAAIIERAKPEEAHIAEVKVTKRNQILVFGERPEDYNILLDGGKWKTIEYTITPNTQEKSTYARTILIKSCNPEISIEEIGEKLTEQKIPHSNLVRLKSGRNGMDSWIVKVSVHTKADYDNLVKFGFKAWMKIHPVVDYVNSNVAQCYKCRAFGHKAAECPSTKEVCLKCAGEHNHNSCTSETPKCANCSEAHYANSPQCPFIQQERNKLQRPRGNGQVSGQHVQYQPTNPPTTVTNTSNQRTDQDQRRLFQTGAWNAVPSTSNMVENTNSIQSFLMSIVAMNQAILKANSEGLPVHEAAAIIASRFVKHMFNQDIDPRSIELSITTSCLWDSGAITEATQQATTAAVDHPLPVLGAQPHQLQSQLQSQNQRVPKRTSFPMGSTESTGTLFPISVPALNRDPSRQKDLEIPMSTSPSPIEPGSLIQERAVSPEKERTTTLPHMSILDLNHRSSSILDPMTSSMKTSVMRAPAIPPPQLHQQTQQVGPQPLPPPLLQEEEREGSVPLSQMEFPNLSSESQLRHSREASPILMGVSRLRELFSPTQGVGRIAGSAERMPRVLQLTQTIPGETEGVIPQMMSLGSRKNDLPLRNQNGI